MAIAERDATSHGATSSVAKLALSGTDVLSLLMFSLLFGGIRPVGTCVAAPLTRGFIREIMILKILREVTWGSWECAIV